MMNRRALARSIAIVGAVATTFACRSTTDVAAPSAAAGTYVLTAVEGRGPMVGTLTLSATGDAERRVRYATGTGGVGSELLAIGRFEIHADSLVLALRENGGRSTYVWQLHASRSASMIRFAYPDPADGEIVETYTRR